MTPDERKADIAWNIAQNPTTVTISCTEMVPFGGGRKEVVSTTGPITIRIFVENHQAAIQSGTAGKMEISAAYSLLADAKANLRNGPHVVQEFETPLGRFRIRTVFPQIVRDELCGYTALLERVS